MAPSPRAGRSPEPPWVLDTYPDNRVIPHPRRGARPNYRGTIRGMVAERDPIAAYLETFERLRARKRWSTDTATYRFVALTLGAAGERVSHDGLEEVAAGLRRRAGWTSPLRSEIRYLVAAMILRRGLDAARVHQQVIATRGGFREHGIKRRGAGATLAALLLVLQAKGKRVPKSHLSRLAQIFTQWRADHFWLTDGNDLPAAALHAGRDLSVESLTADIQRAYARLRDAGFRRGNPLQLVSHMLAADPRGTDTAIQRFAVVADRLREAGERVGTGRYDEVAVLALTQGAPGQVVGRVLRYRDRLRRARPRPSKDIAFSLAAGIELAEDGEKAGEGSAGDLAALQSIRAILDAQQAAAMVAVSASGAAAGSSS